jgi:NAD(P)-dependent dehydrogenase (short-subunit alcohol dehydrogenase family)
MQICQRPNTFDALKDIPSLTDKVLLITGGNIGLGAQCVLEFARHNPSQIYLGARNVSKATTAVAEIQAQLSSPAPIKILEMDLSSLESVKKAAAKFTEEAGRLDVLMLNAGIMATPPEHTTDGYEIQFGTNYLGHALLAKLLLPIMCSTASKPDADVRIVTLTSYGHNYAPKEGIIFDSLKTKGEDLGPYGRYGQSKLSQILWVRKMARLYPQFTLSAIHPGVVSTNLTAGATGSSFAIRMLLKVAKAITTTVEKGARNQLWASVSKDVVSGEYYEPIGVAGGVSERGKDDELAERLWEWTEEELSSYSA